MKAICPKNPKHKRFVTTVHEMHEWVVNQDGAFIKDLGCLEITHDPDSLNAWECKTCGADAIVEA